MAEVKKEDMALNNSEKFRSKEEGGTDLARHAPVEKPAAKAHAVRQAKSSVLAESAAEVGNYLLYDVLIPALKETVANLVTNGINMALFGDAQHKNTTRVGQQTRVNYDRYYNGPSERQGAQRMSGTSRAAQRFDDIVFEARSEAEDVLDAMIQQIADYGYVSVADFLDMSDITPEYTDYDWGWSQLGDATVRPVRRGWIIRLPRVQRLPR